jgi:hypothetical protein
MDKRRLRKIRGHRRSLVVAREHQPYLERIGVARALARLEGLVGDEAAYFRAQEYTRMNRAAATERCRQLRRVLHFGIRHVSTVLAIARVGVTCNTSRTTNDEQRLARFDAVLAAAAPHAEALIHNGLQPTLLDRLAGELAAFRAAKAAIARAGAQFTEATASLDQTLNDADTAILILEGILATSEDAPIGALTALRQAKRVGPRVSGNPATQSVPAALDDGAPQPAETDGRRRRWLPLVLPFVPHPAPRPAAALARDDTPRYASAKSG